MKANVLWFKRDLRINDHLPLKRAIEQGFPIVLLYIFEPELMAADDSDVRHWRFIHESLLQLRKCLPNHTLTIAHSSADEVFKQLMDLFEVQGVYSYQETGNWLSYKRDQRIASFLKSQNTPWVEFQANGVIRGLKNRQSWDKAWHNFMHSPLDEPSIEQLTSQPVHWLIPDETSLPDEIRSPHPHFQPGGILNAQRYAKSFFDLRHRTYSLHISKPEEARKSCSRFSPYLAYGNFNGRFMPKSREVMPERWPILSPAFIGIAISFKSLKPNAAWSFFP
ncbi:MAG: hypothetical protein RLZZ68_1838 [Bacteroidota bacterium]